MLEPVSEDPLVRAGSPGTQLRAMKTTLDASLQDPDTRSINPKTSKPLRKAEVLGWETRNVSKTWLQPVQLHTRSRDRQHTATTQELMAGQLQLHPTYGPGQNSPSDLAALRATRMINTLGRTAIYSNSPYVENVFETLVQHGSVPYVAVAAPAGGSQQQQQGGQTGSTAGGSTGAEPRRVQGRVPRLGSKAAAVRRAKRLLSQVTPFRPEVPFADAVRVAALQHDRTAVPALLDAYILSKPKLSGAQLEFYSQVLAQQSAATQLQAVALLVQQGYYMTAVKVVYADPELLKATLEEMRLIVGAHMDEEQWQAAELAWNWQEADKELFIAQFKELNIITYYVDVRRHLRALRQQGVASLVRVEREMLLKVISDFQAQVEEQLAAAAAAGQAAAAAGGEPLPLGVVPSNSSLRHESSAATASAKQRRSAEAEARIQAEQERKAAARQKIKEERERREAAAAEARAKAKADLDAKRAERAANSAAYAAAQQEQQEQQAALKQQLAAQKQADKEAAAAERRAAAEAAAQAAAAAKAAKAAAMAAAKAHDASAASSVSGSKPAAGLSSAATSPQPPQQQSHPPGGAPNQAAGVRSEPSVGFTAGAQQPELATKHSSASAGEASAQAAAPEGVPVEEPPQQPDVQGEGVAAEAPAPAQQEEAGPQAAEAEEERASAAAGPQPHEHQPGEDAAAAAPPQAEQEPGAPGAEDAPRADADAEAAAAPAAEEAAEPQASDVPAPDPDSQAPAAAEAADAEAAGAHSSARATPVQLGLAVSPGGSFVRATLSSIKRRELQEAAEGGAAQAPEQGAGEPQGSEPQGELSLLQLAAGEAPVPTAGSPKASAPPSPKGSAPVSPKGSAPASPKGSAPASPKAAASPRAGSPLAAGSPRAGGSKPPSRLGSLSVAADAPAPLQPLDSPTGSQRRTPPSRSLSSLSQQQGGTAPGDAERASSRAGVEEGLADLKRAGLAARESAQQAIVAAHSGKVSLAGSRQSTPVSARRSVQELVASMEQASAQAKAAEKAEIAAVLGDTSAAADFEAQRAKLAAEMSEEQHTLEKQVAEKAAKIAALEMARQQLHSARSSELGATPRDRPLTPQEQKQAAVVDAQLASVEEKLRLEKQALEVLETQKRRHEEEKRELNDQLARTMKLFQEQLAHTIKMAAMLQAQRIMTGAPAEAAPQLPQVPLPQEVDEPPTEEEIKDYARYLGMDVEHDADLLYIAEWALTAPVPEGWTVHLDQEGHEFFFNAGSNKSQYEHPMDEHYKEYYHKKRAEKTQKHTAATAPRAKAIRV